MVIVTGASRGLGLAISERLVESGVQVCGLARDVSNIKTLSYKCDVGSYESVRNVAKILKRQEVPVQALINTAGIASMNLALTSSHNVTQQIISTNLLGTIYCCQLFGPLLIRNKQGSIINFTTMAVALGLKGESIYIASKAGIEAFTRSFAREMADFKIRVNCVGPGPIDTDLIKGVNSDAISKVIERQVIPIQFTKSDVCDVVEGLLDRRMSSLSGQVLYIGGI